MPFSKTAVPVLASAVLLFAGCSDQDASGTDGQTSESFEFGQPAKSQESDRVIEIEASDDFRFDPEAVDVKKGEVITFTVNNVGEVPHEFTLGPADVQDEHAEEMAEMGDMEMDGDPNAISIGAGETNGLTWEFTEAGSLLFGCHIPGHYEAGMVGDVDVAAD